MTRYGDNSKYSRYPIYSISTGSQAADVPVLAFIGGVHGVKRFGTPMIQAYFASLVRRKKWDASLQATLSYGRRLPHIDKANCRAEAQELWYY